MTQKKQETEYLLKQEKELSKRLEVKLAQGKQLALLEKNTSQEEKIKSLHVRKILENSTRKFNELYSENFHI